MSAAANSSEPVRARIAAQSPALNEREPGYPFGSRVPKAVRVTELPDEAFSIPLGPVDAVWVNGFGAVCAVDDNGYLQHLPPGTFEVVAWHHDPIHDLS